MLLLLLADYWLDVFDTYFHNFRFDFFDKEIKVYDRCRFYLQVSSFNLTLPNLAILLTNLLAHLATFLPHLTFRGLEKKLASIDMAIVIITTITSFFMIVSTCLFAVPEKHSAMKKMSIIWVRINKVGPNRRSPHNRAQMISNKSFLHN